MRAYGKVGKKGTLYPPKKLREELGLKEGDTVQYITKDNNLLIVKIPDPLKVANKFNISFDTKEAIKIIGEVKRESEKEIEKEILKNIKKEN
jgi:AbrB family looped-hinge helix DNA binding protein